MGNLDKIGRSIRSLRKANKITLQQMASETGLSVSYTHLDVYKRQVLKVRVIK